MATEVATETVRKEWNDFKSFAFKGNAFDLAVGVIVGAAFGRIVDGIVNLLIMPIIGALTGGLNFDEYFLPLSGNVTSTVLGEAQKQGAVLAYGAFITVVINFLLVWLVPRLIKKPTGIKVLDDTVLYLNSSKSFLLSSSIVVALVMYGSHYWVDTQAAGGAAGPAGEGAGQPLWISATPLDDGAGALAQAANARTKTHADQNFTCITLYAKCLKTTLS